MRYSLFMILALAIFGCRSEQAKEEVTPTPKIPCALEDYSTTETPYTISVPSHFPNLPGEITQGLTEEKVSLGRMLFYDPILSGDSTMSCASCHRQENSFTDPKSLSVGIDGIPGNRSSMSLVNLAFSQNGFFWDGRSATLQTQALIPVEDPVELHATWPEVIDKIKKAPRYLKAFKEAYPINSCDSIDRYLVADALARFQSTIVSFNTKFDRVKQGQAFFTDAELRGFDKFFDVSLDVVDAECGHCHTDPLFTSNRFLNNGIQEAASLEDFQDKGHGLVSGIASQNGMFKAPTLRNILLTAPYMHKGQLSDIESVLEHYSSGGKYSPNKDPLLYPTNLTEQDKEDLIAFLKTLTDSTLLTKEAFSNPFE